MEKEPFESEWLAALRLIESHKDHLFSGPFWQFILCVIKIPYATHHKHLEKNEYKHLTDLMEKSDEYQSVSMHWDLRTQIHEAIRT